MPNGHVLELSTLPARHPPIGEALLHAFGPPAIIRLSVDPSAQPAGTMTRSVDVDWVPLPGANPAGQVQRDIGWNGLQNIVDTVCVQLPMTVNAQTLTEQAAIAVMALLISDLEDGCLQSVLQIGSGSDYLLLPRKGSNPIPVEVSGVREDATGNASRARLSEKKVQVLTRSDVGHVSVTTFAHAGGSIVHSYLHYVNRGRKKKGRKKGKTK